MWHSTQTEKRTGDSDLKEILEGGKWINKTPLTYQHRNAGVSEERVGNGRLVHGSQVREPPFLLSQDRRGRTVGHERDYHRGRRDLNGWRGTESNWIHWLKAEGRVYLGRGREAARKEPGKSSGGGGWIRMKCNNDWVGKCHNETRY